MVLSYNPPNKIVRKLQTKEKAPFDVCSGNYQLSGNRLFLTLNNKNIKCELKITGREENTQRHTITKTTFKMVFFFP